MEIRQNLVTPQVERNPQQTRPAAKKSAALEGIAERSVNAAETPPRTGNAESHAKAASFQRDAGYDKPQGPAILALEAYGSHEREVKRAAIRQMMGVDLYA